MLLKMKTSMGGPTLSIANGDEIPFGDDFPFSVNEVHRFCAADVATLVGTDEEVAAWLAANPYDDVADAPASNPASAAGDVDKNDDEAADDAKAAADPAEAEPAPAAEPAAAPASKPAAAKAAAKKG